MTTAELPIRPCHVCGAPCDWCKGSNEARKAFPRAKVAPLHDADHDDPTKHHCVACFEKIALEGLSEDERRKYHGG